MSVDYEIILYFIVKQKKLNNFPKEHIFFKFWKKHSVFNIFGNLGRLMSLSLLQINKKIYIYWHWVNIFENVPFQVRTSSVVHQLQTLHNNNQTQSPCRLQPSWLWEAGISTKTLQRQWWQRRFLVDLQTISWIEETISVLSRCLHRILRLRLASNSLNNSNNLRK